MPTIIFETFDAPQPGEFQGGLTLGGRFSWSPSYLSGGLRIGGGFLTEPAPPEPPPPPAGAMTGLALSMGGAFAAPPTPGTFGGSLTLGGALHWSPSHFAGDLRLGGSFGTVPPPPTPGDDEVYGLLTDGIAFGTASPNPLPIAVLRDVLASAAGAETTVETGGAVVESVAFSDALSGVQYLLVQEGIVFGSDVVATPLQIARIVERLLLEGHANTYVEAIDTIVVGLAFGTIASTMPVGTATDTLVTDSVIVETVTHMLRLVETLLLQSTGIGSSTAVALVREGVVFDSSLGAGTTVEVGAILREAVSFVARLSVDNGEYIAWVLNTESRGLSRYTQWPYNSFAKIGDKYFAADTTGLHRLGGNTDNGESILARLRLGLQDMGTRKLKRVPELFWALRGDTAYLQVITVAEDGIKEAAIYKMRVRPGSNIRENRTTIGRGLKSIDWDFVLENVDGGDLDIKQLEFRPLILDRRTRG